MFVRRQTVENVFQKYKVINDSILRTPPLQKLSCRSPPRSPSFKRTLPPSAAEDNDVKETAAEDNEGVKETPVADFIEKYKRTTGNRKTVVTCFLSHNPPITDESSRIIGFKKLDLLKSMRGVRRLDLSDKVTLTQCDKLLDKWYLGPVTGFQIENDVHYGVYDSDNNLVTYMSILTGVYDRSPRPKKIAVSVDWIVDANPGKSEHIASSMVEYLKNEVGKYNWSDVFTQCADKIKAKRFWSGKLSNGKLKANILVGFFHLCSDQYTIYLDSINMCT